MRFPFKLCLSIAVSLALAGCGGLTVERAPLADPLPAPEDAQPSPVGFNKIYYAIPTGTPLVSRSPKGALGLLSCSFPYGMVAQGGVSARMFPNDDFRRIFLDTLRAQGYDVAGDPGRMFDEEEDMMRAAYSVGARVLDVKADLCRKTSPLGGVDRGDTGEAAMTVEWTVFDLLHRRSVLKTTTKGYAELGLPNYEAVALMLEQAFAAAAHNLAADQAFHDLVFFGVEPSDVPDAIEDLNENPVTLFDPDEDVQLAKRALSKTPAKTRFGDIVKTAVMIQAGHSHGSGFFITRDGHILTNAHVVGNALRVRVVMAGKKEKAIAEVLRVDRKRDVALLRLESVPEGMEIPVLPLRTEEPAVGETVYAIGAPAKTQLQDTVTHGIVSAHRIERRTRQRLIQADAFIHGGSSGGMLLDDNGNIIGMAVSGWQDGDVGLDRLNNFIPIGDALKKLQIGH